MTEKRYTITIGLNKEFKEIIDHCRQDKHISVFEFLKQVGEQDKAFKKLKQENKELKKENEQLKQFKEDVLNKIDMHLRMLPTARDNEFNEDDGDPSLYSGAIYMLETLKKELQE